MRKTQCNVGSKAIPPTRHEIVLRTKGRDNGKLTRRQYSYAVAPVNDIELLTLD
jgi:hypothetical protein